MVNFILKKLGKEYFFVIFKYFAILNPLLDEPEEEKHIEKEQHDYD